MSDQTYSYPQHDKLRAVKDKTQTINDFLEFLEENGVELVRFKDDWRLTRQQRDKFIAEFFEIDLDELEREKRAMIERLREYQ